MHTTPLSSARGSRRKHVRERSSFSRTVNDVATGSGFVFEDVGEHELNA
jgi:hypothetical protein